MEINPDPLSDIVLDYLFLKRRETPELDFKYFLDISKKSNFPQIAKDFFAFSNFGGGHILLGFMETETGSYELKGLPKSFHIDQATLQEKFNAFSNEPIVLDYREFEKSIEGVDKKFAAIYIPPSRCILKPIKTGSYVNKKGINIRVYEKDDIFYRRGSQSIKASYNEMKYVEKRSKEYKDLSILTGEPDIISETLYSNLFLVLEIPKKIYDFDASHNNEFEENLIKDKKPYFKTGNIIYAFYDESINEINSHMLTNKCRINTVIHLIEQGNQNIITALLNKTLINFNKNIGLDNDWRNKQVFFYPSSEIQLKKSWKSRYKESTRLVAQRIYVSKLNKYVYWHLASEMRFTIIGDNYVLLILPKIILTYDGYNVIHGFKEGTVITRLTYDEYNNKFLNHILFWKYQLNPFYNETFTLYDKIVIKNEPINVNFQYGIKYDRPAREFKDRDDELYYIEEEIL